MVKLIFFVKPFGLTYKVLRIKKNDDEKWHFFEGNQQNFDNHVPIVKEKVEGKKLTTRGGRVMCNLEGEILDIYYDQINNQFKFKGVVLSGGKCLNQISVKKDFNFN